MLDTLPVSCLPIVPRRMLFLRRPSIFWCFVAVLCCCPSSRLSGLLSIVDSCMLSLEPGAVEIELFPVVVCFLRSVCRLFILPVLSMSWIGLARFLDTPLGLCLPRRALACGLLWPWWVSVLPLQGLMLELSVLVVVVELWLLFHLFEFLGSLRDGDHWPVLPTLES